MDIVLTKDKLRVKTEGIDILLNIALEVIHHLLDYMFAKGSSGEYARYDQLTLGIRDAFESNQILWIFLEEIRFRGVALELMTGCHKGRTQHREGSIASFAEDTIILLYQASTWEEVENKAELN
nr:unnamed protein product [Callosobruchus analis]